MKAGSNITVIEMLCFALHCWELFRARYHS